ncbi:MAG: NFACT RNA binding domain-containing protein [Candidatus Diapherotrites archaeon]
MKIELDLKKSLMENANSYFEKSKKAKRKLEGLKRAIEDTSKKLEELKARKSELKEKKLLKKRKKEWYEKFHWFYSSDGLLVLAGRDAQSNEELIKKHMEEKNDLYFHAEIQGSPHCIIKTKEHKAPEETQREAAEFVASYSKAWNEGLSSIDVYSVLPEQVSKSAPTGTSMKTGSFMIYGQRKWFKKTPLEFAIGVKKEGENFIVIGGPPSAVKKHSVAFLQVMQGKEKKGDTAKKIKALLEKKIGAAIDLDEIISVLPNGGLKIKG